ncbi:ankyrin repeat domain-containing protein 27-like isoform X2 [Atheta coriaria]
MNRYDENLKENAFYQRLLDYPLSLEDVSNNDWIICVPRRGTVMEPITLDDILSHILVPNDEIPNRFRTLNNIIVNIKNGKLDVEDRVDYMNSIEILFDETFYHERMKYKVYCIDFPICGNYAATSPIKVIINLRDCIDFLWIETYGRVVFDKITQVCHSSIARYESDNADTSPTLEDTIERMRDLFHFCLDVTLECNVLRDNIKTDDLLYFNLTLATETYMQHVLKEYLFPTITSITSYDDGNLNKRTRNLQDIQMKHLDLQDFQDVITSAKCALKKINQYSTTLGKMHCLKTTFQILADATDQHNEEVLVDADDLIALFAFLIIKLNVNNWIANLTFLKHFMFCRTETQDEAAYLVTTLEAAINYINGPSLFEELYSDANTSQNRVIVEVANCNLENLKRLFPEETLDFCGENPDHNPNLCHPLCACDKCEQILIETRLNTLTCYGYTDDKGRNCLHIACMFGFSEIVDFLLHKGIPCHVADYSGSYPLHHAARHGRIDPLLLLLNVGANVNAMNASGNSALHLAANNGHENCIKGLLCHSQLRENALDLNACNNWGETALHLASKWGYAKIVQMLLQYKIDFSIRNKRNETAMDVAQNENISKLILSFIKANGLESIVESVRFHTPEINELICDTENSWYQGVRPTNFEQFKKTDKLLKAIQNNDLPLSCFYLGIPVSPHINNPNKPTEIPQDNVIRVHYSPPTCHPLCDCPRCVRIMAPIQSVCVEEAKLNVNICNSEGFTPLHVAAQFGRCEMLRLLLDASANCNLQTYQALYTPLHLAVINQRVHVVKELLLSGSCKLDLKDGKGNTALHYACRKNDVRILDLLLTKGADAHIQNKAGKTVLHLAQEKSLFAAVNVITQDRCYLRSPDEDLFTND